MGGHAFASGPNPLYTPRMPRQVYCHARDHCHAVLRERFLCVASPIEGPGKEDFGDIDILVALEKRLVFPKRPRDQEPRSPRDVLNDVKGSLGAVAVMFDHGGVSANMALPWPVDVAGDDAIGRQDAHPEPQGPCFIQVDVRICNDVEDLQWRLFIHAHGDIWNLLGSTIRPFGLTVDDQAMWLRIPEIEELDRKKARVFLTRDPSEIIAFLGMKAEGFWENPFSSIEALFEYVTTCRLFLIRRASAEGEVHGDQSSLSGDRSAGVQGGAQGRRSLKANDRKRIKSRPVFRKWIDEFIPACQAVGRGLPTDPNMTVDRMRDNVRAEAFDRFQIGPEYNTRVTDWRRVRQHDEVWRSVIKGAVPQDLDPSFRGCLTNALRKIIMQDDGSYGFAPTQPLRDTAGFYDIDATRLFIAKISDALGPVAWAKQQQRAREIQEQKELKRKATGDTGGEQHPPRQPESHRNEEINMIKKIADGTS